MPVLGHAFVGLATATVTRPHQRASLRAAFWVPVVIGLAYLPDLAAQLMVVGGSVSDSVATHSLVFLFAATVVAAPVLAWLGGVSLVRAGVIVFVSVGAHLLLDLLQAKERVPLWPFLDRKLGLGLRLIPVNSLTEFLVFAGAFGAFITWWHFRQQTRAILDTRPEVGHGTGFARLTWLGRALAVMILTLAAITHYLTHQRRQQLEDAKRLINTGAYEQALSVLDEAARWPAPFNAGSIPFFQGRAWLGLGERDRAATLFRVAYEREPEFIYAVEQLALMDASLDGSMEERLSRVGPWLKILREQFADHPRLPRIRQKLERRLGCEVDLPTPAEP